MIESKTISKPEIKTLQVSSKAFENGGNIPSKYTCDGININPPIDIGNIPQKTRSLVLVVDDPDAPIRMWVHWIVWNIPPTKKIKEAETKGVEGINDFGQYHYGGPCPHSGTHHYHFKVYALDNILHIHKKSTKYDLEKAMNSHIIAFGDLVGLYRIELQ